MGLLRREVLRNGDNKGFINEAFEGVPKSRQAGVYGLKPFSTLN